MANISKTTLWGLQESVNHRRHTKNKIDIVRRNGYYCIDNYQGNVTYECNLTAKEVAMFLHGMIHCKYRMTPHQ